MLNLTERDWNEIYAALESKRASVTTHGDTEWRGHLTDIMFKIGPDGREAYKATASKPDARPEDERQAIVEMAKEQYEDEGRIEIDDDAKLSEGNDNGTYVAAWVWVYFHDTKFDKETEEA